MEGVSVEKVRSAIEEWELKTGKKPLPVPLGVVMLAAKREGYCIYKGTKSQKYSLASALQCAAGKKHREALQMNQPPLTKAQKKAAQTAAQARAKTQTMNDIFSDWGWSS